ncbi:MAG: hypothetical protein LBT06_18430 [Hungatella sp.]|jgi:hypothetical protein|nr:hypothetical protein [Hungatella sp.]MDR1772143.1 hypothetical protein [Hungatella sp.]MDR2025916.1 hypothetical protein [Hungatella sp.]
MNLMNLMQLKESWAVFKDNHPKFPLFLKAALKGPLKEGSVVEIRITSPEGKDLTTNLKIKASDMELLERWKDSFV